MHSVRNAYNRALRLEGPSLLTQLQSDGPQLSALLWNFLPSLPLPVHHLAVRPLTRVLVLVTLPLSPRSYQWLTPSLMCRMLSF